MGLFSNDIATFEDPFLHQLQHVHHAGNEITRCGTLIAWPPVGPKRARRDATDDTLTAMATSKINKKAGAVTV